ncbi:MAG TPA: hypothetical protein VF791_13310 [Pyrinomonadaceae bacterium]
MSFIPVYLIAPFKGVASDFSQGAGNDLRVGVSLNDLKACAEG